MYSACFYRILTNILRKTWFFSRFLELLSQNYKNLLKSIGQLYTTHYYPKNLLAGKNPKTFWRKTKLFFSGPSWASNPKDVAHLFLPFHRTLWDGLEFRPKFLHTQRCQYDTIKENKGPSRSFCSFLRNFDQNSTQNRVLWPVFQIDSRNSMRTFWRRYRTTSHGSLRPKECFARENLMNFCKKKKNPTFLLRVVLGPKSKGKSTSLLALLGD